MSRNLWTSNGTSIQLGRELGKGGEGSVHELPAASHLVAKLYHEAPTPLKQEKLRFMATHAHKELLAYSAWPTDTLHGSRGGPVIGFVMEKVAQKQPIHMLYSPAHRKQDYPKAAWDFLLYAARNTAAAFDAIHRHGHVLGDVNQGNVMVGRDSKVFLIDSDSMQIATGGKIHLCEVGVSHFTPPELQGISSFSTTARTLNHDAFGLALLIFHLLFGGRHPFAGRPLRDDVGNGLEPDIKAFRFAYGADAAQRGFAPPPRSIPFSIVPSSTQAMFQRAFTEPGALVLGRPKATDWLAELDRLRSSLKTCGKSKMHVYPRHVPNCPWCALDNAGTHFFIDLGVVITNVGSTFVLTKVWAAIESIQPPKPPAYPQPSQFTTKANPLPEGVRKSKGRVGSFVVTAVIAAVLIAIFPKVAVLTVLLAGGIWLTVSGGETPQYVEEMRRREKKREDAQKVYDQLLSTLTQATSAERFDREKAQLNGARQSHMNLPNAEKKMTESVTAKARERQLRDHLDRYFIDDASISGLGPAKKAALRSFGIETAADITASSVGSVRGFGPKLTSAMMTWKRACEARFRFDASPQALQADIVRVRNEIAVQRQAVEATLQGGVERLARMKAESDALVARTLPAIATAANELAQATADMGV